MTQERAMRTVEVFPSQQFRFWYYKDSPPPPWDMWSTGALRVYYINIISIYLSAYQSEDCTISPFFIIIRITTPKLWLETAPSVHPKEYVLKSFFLIKLWLGRPSPRSIVLWILFFFMLDLCIIIKQARRHPVVTSRAREREGEKEKENESDEAL